jgi:hypothetical protein
MSTIKVDTWQDRAGTQDFYGALAWVNFDGTGTPAIRASGNVSSITDNATGDYTVNFTVAMTDANYSSAGMSGVLDASTNANIYVSSYNQLAGSLRVRIYAGATLYDFNNVSVVILR